MALKIGFVAEIEKKAPEQAAQNPQKTKARRSVVDVYFADRHATYAYYNDTFDLTCGDFVYVEGKMEGLRGRVVQVSYAFKIKLSDYKRVIGVADTAVAGEFRFIGSHAVTRDCLALPYEQAITWFAPPLQGEEVVSSADEKTFLLDDLAGMDIAPHIAERGLSYYAEDRVVYLELKDGKGRAIVLGTKPYEVEFEFHKGEISGLLCSCYCTGTCKHEFAAMLQLRDLRKKMDEAFGGDLDEDYFAAVSKSALFEYVMEKKTGGSLQLCLDA